MELSILDPALPKREPSAKYLKERDICMGHFQYWNEQVRTWDRIMFFWPKLFQDQIDFVEELLLSMHHHQVIRENQGPRVYTFNCSNSHIFAFVAILT